MFITIINIMSIMSIITIKMIFAEEESKSITPSDSPSADHLGTVIMITL